MKYVCVIGGANIDISSTAFNPLIVHDSNPSKTTMSLGGVGRNIAENLSALGVKVEFISVLGNDSYAKQIEENCYANNISTRHCLRVNDKTSTYLCVNDEKGDMFIGASDMGILDMLTTEYLKSKLRVINGAQAVVVDTNLTSEVLDFLFKNVTAPVFVETVSANKTKKLAGLSGYYGIKPNVIEAEMLTGTAIKTDADFDITADKLHAQGCKWVIITRGEKGAYFSDGETRGFAPEIHANVVNTTGAGDSFFAAMLWAFVEGQDIHYAACAGNVAASLTIESKNTVSGRLNTRYLKERLQN